MPTAIPAIDARGDVNSARMGIKALTVDVFGTVTDWYSTIVREGERLGCDKGITVDWARFATAWRGGYEPAMGRVRSGELPWMKLARHYKPDREVYEKAAHLLDLEPPSILMVAAHRHDLEGARAVGFRTAFIPRPLEWGPEGQADTAQDGDFDIIAQDDNLYGLTQYKPNINKYARCNGVQPGRARIWRRGALRS